MEKGQKVAKKAEVVRIPPPRGRVKAKIFSDAAKKVKLATSVIGLFKRERVHVDGGSSSTCNTPPPDDHTSESYSGGVSEPASQNRQ